MRRFISVSILAEETRKIGLFAASEFVLSGKKLVELFGKLRISAVKLHQSRDIVRYKERILPGIPFGESKSHFVRREGLDKTAVLFWPHEARGGIEKILKISCACRVFLIVAAVFGTEIRVIDLINRRQKFFVARGDHLCHLGDAPVVIGVFERL